MHSHHGQHQGHHITLETLHINPAALLYSPTGGMMRVSSGALAPSMLLPAQAGAMPPHSPTGTSMPLISSQLEGKSHKHSLSFDDTDSLSDNEGNSDSGEGPRKRGRVETVERKTKKCAMERKRRKDLNEGFHGLRQALPLTISRPSKTTLLHYAVDYIKQLEAEVSHLRDENRALRKAMTG
ncbi:Helixloop-helix DNA-binding domain containing protein [Acanthamoeba castellanii str. Neff]|uniref:Helixloop-helix DNA-binding domain containing protein n=1 Tax=Acanthamoeba castellanii (strain ATCC 30010 / Neff) TaxID=1257118 RepID=L8GW38_ACACF|nr:Helixloop-helix DNA-binding domain containing protein [Acanthamoeba castellanii str. Neff]ELR16306.1 Helixloop-helix DNA-binding domain containing protein [Acanthamoeba castellanii str. Neff]